MQRHFKFRFLLLILGLLILSCQDDVEQPAEKIEQKTIAKVETKPKVFGFDLSDFEVVFDTVKPGETFGTIMDSYGVQPSKVYQITQSIPDSVMNFRKINFGKPYARYYRASKAFCLSKIVDRLCSD